MENIINMLNEHYALTFDRFELLREGGSISYAVFSGDDKYFLRVISPAFFDTAATGADIQVFLRNKGFPVPLIIFTKENLPYIKTNDKLLILYEFIDGAECEPEQDAKKIGALIGKLHSSMKDYKGRLIKRDKQFYIGRYIDILRKVQYPRVDEYIAYGDDLWEKIKDLPMGYSHGDMYCGNIHKTPEGKLYIIDFDTSCEGFPIYDLALICNRTDFFVYDESRLLNTKTTFEEMLPEYQKFNSISQSEINSFYDIIALYHFTLQATIMEIHGSNCVDSIFLDNQLDWLYRWRKQCDDVFKW